MGTCRGLHHTFSPNSASPLFGFFCVSPCCAWGEVRLLPFLISPPISIYREIAPKRQKISEKCRIIFVECWSGSSTYQKEGIMVCNASSSWFLRLDSAFPCVSSSVRPHYARARITQEYCFFCCHICHTSLPMLERTRWNSMERLMKNAFEELSHWAEDESVGRYIVKFYSGTRQCIEK